MIKHAAAFLAAFVVGAFLALAVRAALHRPFAVPPSSSAAPDSSNADVRSSAAASLPAAVQPPARETPTNTTAERPTAAPVPNSPGATVNTLCPICGMKVDPSIRPAQYRGALVGFGCRACPPKFAREPDRYGPAALKNEVVED